MSANHPRILLLTNEFRPVGGGIATYCHELCLALQRAGAGMAVVAADKGPDATAFDAVQPFPVERSRERRLAPLRHAGRYRALQQAIDRERPDWLWASDWRTGLVVAAVGARRGLPYIVSAYGSELLRAGQRSATRNLARRVLNGAAAVLSISRYTSGLLAGLGVAEARIMRIPPGTDPAAWRSDPAARQIVRARYGLLDRPVILSLSRLTARKGHDMLLAALPAVLTRVPAAVLLIAGTGAARGRLERLVIARKLQGHVLFTGFVPEAEKRAIYAAADVYALLSRQEGDDVEGFGITLLEAAACGLPVVAGNHGGVPDALIDGETGLLVDPLAPPKIAAALLALLQDPARAAAMGARGRQRVVDTANWTAAAAQLLALLQTRERAQ